MYDLGEKDVQDSQARNLTTRNKGKEPIIPDNVDTPADDEFSLGSSPYLSVAKSSRAMSCQRRSHRPTATLIVACSAGREGKQAEDITNQTECLGMHLHYPRA